MPTSPTSLDLFVPGRVCLLGEHSDWAGAWRTSNPEIPAGRALLVGTREGIRARVRRTRGVLRIIGAPSSQPSNQIDLPLDPDTLLDLAQAGGLFSYVAGVAWQVLRRHPSAVDGLEIHQHDTDLPLRRGLSSSAAICLLIARAFNRLYQLGYGLRGEMDLAFLGERTTPSRCGRLDQGCAFGSRVVRMWFDGDSWNAEPIPVASDLHLVLVDLCAAKDTQRILAELNSCYPFPKTEIARRVHEALGAQNQTLVARAQAALSQGDPAALGQTMTDSQRIFDQLVAPACPSELLAPKLHLLLDHPGVRALSHGGKGVGSQGDGSAQLVTRDLRSQQDLMALVERELSMKSMKLTIPMSR